jgi:hypothetical protein
MRILYLKGIKWEQLKLKKMGYYVLRLLKVLKNSSRKYFKARASQHVQFPDAEMMLSG